MNLPIADIVIQLIDSDGNFLTKLGGNQRCAYALIAPRNIDFSHRNYQDLITREFSDPRVASISLVAASPQESEKSRSRRVAFPTSNFVLVNLSFSDLIGEVTLEGIQSWCEEASNHGLFHLEVKTESQSIYELNDFSNLTSSRLFQGKYSDLETTKLDGEILKSIDLAVDCSWLGENETGAQTVISYFLKSLTNHESISRIFLINLPSGIPKYCDGRIDLSRVTVGYPEIGDEVDIYWRPCQPDFFFDILEARKIAKRVVVTYFDLIAYDIPSYPYNLNFEQWMKYRDIQERNAYFADLIITISDDVRNQMCELFGMINSNRIRTVGVGVDHIFSEVKDLPIHGSSDVERLAGEKYILFLGTNYPHKNLTFARRIMNEAFPGNGKPNLIIAGLMLPSGEADSVTELNSSEFQLGSVSTEDRNFLLKNAELVLYPTTAEGFGLVPFEAAALGTPTLFTRFGPLREMFPLDFLPDDWELASYVNATHKLLADDELVKLQVEQATGLANGRLSWQSVTNELVDSFYYALENRSSYIDKAALNEIEHSLSWRVTAPLRIFGRMLKRVRYSKAVAASKRLPFN
jgi:glycosyltransferase involved in cell wall biosynthesis